MKMLQISDDVYLKLKTFVADPFEDTPNNVLLRLMDIAEKAKGRWSAFEPPAKTPVPEPVEEPPAHDESVPEGTKIPDPEPSATEVVL